MNRVIVLTTAILLACGAFVYALPDDERRAYYDVSNAFRETSKEQVYIAARNIPRGTPLREEDFREVRWPSVKVPGRAVASIEDIERFFARREVLAGTPLVYTDVSARRPRLSPNRGRGEYEIIVEQGRYNERRAPVGATVDVIAIGADGRKVRAAENVRILQVKEGGVVATTMANTKSSRILRSGITLVIGVSPEQQEHLDASLVNVEIVAVRPHLRRKKGVLQERASLLFPRH